MSQVDSEMLGYAALTRSTMLDVALPNGWAVARISDIAEKGKQRTPIDDEEFIYVDIGSIDRNLKKITEPQTLLGKDAPSRARKVINTGDVLVSLTRPNLNAVALVGQELDNQIASTGFEVIKPDIVDSRYIFSLVRSKPFIDSISGKVQGALYPAAKSDDVRGYEFLLPALAEQQQIAAKLDELLAQVDNLKTRLDNIPKILKRFRQSVLAAAVSGKLTEDWRVEHKYNAIINISEKCFEERKSVLKKAKKSVALEDAPILELPISWSWNSIDEACLKITDGTHHSPKSYLIGDYMYITSKNVREGYINLSNITFVDQKTHSEIYSRCDVVKGDVLYVKDGANTGLSCVNNISEEISLLSSVGVLRPTSFINAKYLEHYLNSPIGRKVMLDMIGGTAIMRLTLTKIMRSPLSIPPIEEQTEIVARVEQLFAYADQIEQRVKDAQSRVNHLTQAILAKAFRGELTAEWRAQNPDLISGENSAEALLARIQEERETVVVTKKTVKKEKA